LNSKIVIGWMTAQGLPAPATEWRFDSQRKWRFDYAWPSAKVALEIEGGVWTGGRHVQPKGFLKDMDKYNAAALQGWCLLRTTPQKLLSQPTADMLKQALEGEAP